MPNFSDNFNRPNSATLGGGWDSSVGFGILDNKLHNVGNIANPRAVKNIGVSDQFSAEVQVATWRTNNLQTGLMMLRYVNESNYILLMHEPNSANPNTVPPQCYFFIFTGGSIYYDSFFVLPANRANGDVFKVEVRGTEFKVFANGTLVGTRTLNYPALANATNVTLLMSNDSTTQFDNFEVVDFNASTSNIKAILNTRRNILL